MSRKLCLRNRQRTCAVDLPFLRQIAWHLLTHHFGRDQFTLAIHLIADPEMTQLNEQFLGHLGSTDVITFDLKNEEAELSGLSAVTYRDNQSSHGSFSSRKRMAKKGAANPSKAAPCSGEIFISIDQTLTQARPYGTIWQKELVRYVIHGLLHLHGFEDLTPSARRKMKRVENRLLQETSRAFDLKRLSRTKGPAPSKLAS
jgi:rRNA maturation RNase YbeY